MEMGRRNDIDWLRTFASYLVVIYHAAQFFDFQMKTYFKNAERSEVLEAFTQFVHLWHMPLFFMLAGWASYFSLNSRGAGRFLLERVQRLLVPLIFGIVVLCAPPRWVEFKNGMWKTTAGEYRTTSQSMGFITFLQQYYYRDGMTWSHLWFLSYLFTFSVIYLPGLWVLCKIPYRESEVHKWAWMLTNAPVVVLGCVQLRLRDRWPGYQNLFDDWANFWFYSIFFVAGFCLARYRMLEDDLQLSVKRNGVLGFSACFLYMFRHRFSQLNSKPDAFQHVLSAFVAWYVVCSLLAFARRTFSHSPCSQFWVNNAFPVYVIHDVPLCLTADSILRQWKVSVMTKFVFSAALSLLCSLLFLSIVVENIPPFKFLLGMKNSKSLVHMKMRSISRRN